MNENGLFSIFFVNCSFVYRNTSAFWSLDKKMLESSLVPHYPGLVVTTITRRIQFCATVWTLRFCMHLYKKRIEIL